MSDSSKAEGQLIQGQLHKARRAEVPNLAEVRKYQEMFYEFLDDRRIEIMEINRINEILAINACVVLDVINNDSPSLSDPRGFCSPVKSTEIKRFENMLREVFGPDIGPCTTAWSD
mgnify:CR=1 FL=1